MKGKPFGPDDWRRVYAAIDLHGAILTAARALKISYGACRRAYLAAIRSGEDGGLGLPPLARATMGQRSDSPDVRRRMAARRGELGTRPVLPGFVITQTTAVQDGGGHLEREFIQQRPEHGAAFSVPDGHRIKGVSALVDSDGREIVKWLKTTENPTPTAIVVDALKAVFAGYRGRARVVPLPTAVDADLLTVYNIADHHLGMHAWSRETGADYDVKIASRLLLTSMARLVASTPASKRAVILNLGDFIHADNNSARTERSGNALDVDTRYAKVLMTGVRLLIECVEMALAKHDEVVVRCLPGNHDPHTALALTIAIGNFFAANPRVTVDDDPSKYWMLVHGRTLLAATHGDMVRPTEIAGVIASNWPQEWGATLYRYAYFGHVHHRSRGGEASGVVWETFQTLAPRDAWHSGMGYGSGRSMVAITHHADTGELLRNSANIPPFTRAA